MDKSGNPVAVQVRAAQQGDRDAFARLVEDHYDQVFGCAMKLTGNRAAAEDIAHEACIKLAHNLGQFRFESSFSTWLYRLTVNCAHDYLRSQARHSGAQLPPELTAPPAAPDAAILLGEVLLVIESLGDGFRDVAALVVGEGLSHREAALILGIQESTVSWRLHEMRKRLGERLPEMLS